MDDSETKMISDAIHRSIQAGREQGFKLALGYLKLAIQHDLDPVKYLEDRLADVSKETSNDPQRLHQEA